MRRVAAVLVAVLLAGCVDGPGTPPAPALHDVWVAIPEPGDQALVIGFDAAWGSFSPADGFHAFESRVGDRVVVVSHSPLQAGETRVGTVSGANQTGSGSAGPSGARVLEAARYDRSLRESVAGYGVRFLPR